MKKPMIGQEAARYDELSREELIRLCEEKDKGLLSLRGRLSLEVKQTNEYHSRWVAERKQRIDFLNSFLFRLGIARMDPLEKPDFIAKNEEHVLFLYDNDLKSAL